MRYKANKDDFIAAINEGCSVAEVGKRLDITRSIARYWLKKFGLQTERQSTYRLSGKSHSQRMTEKTRNTKALLVEEAGGKCLDCGLIAPPFVYDFDHRDPATKKFTIGIAIHRAKDQLKKEVEKCDLVCANCHRWRTHRQCCYSDSCDYCNSLDA